MNKYQIEIQKKNEKINETLEKLERTEKMNELLLEILQQSRYNPSHSIYDVENLTEQEWEKMKKDGARELKPYYSKARGTYNIALSVGYDENHKRIRKVLSAKTESEVIKKYHDFIRNNHILKEEESKFNDKSEQKFEDYIINKLKVMSIDSSDRTRENTEVMSKHIISALGNYRMKELTKDILLKFMDDFLQKKHMRNGEMQYYRQSSVTKVYSTLKRLLREAEEEGIIDKNFLYNVRTPKSRQHDEVDEDEKTFTVEEMVEILKALKNDKLLKIWVEMLICTGCRPSEILGIQFSDINKEECTVKINKAITFSIKKDENRKGNSRKKKRHIPYIGPLKNDRNGKSKFAKRTLKLPQMVIDDIEDWKKDVENNKQLMQGRQENRTTDLIFTNDDGKMWQYNSYEARYKRTLIDCKLEANNCNLYKFRHTIATLLIDEEQNDLKTVQALIGDNTSKMVLDKYINIKKKKVLESSEKHSKNVERILKPKKDKKR